MNISRTDTVDTEDKANDGLYKSTNEADIAQGTEDSANTKSVAFNKAYLGTIKSDMFKKRRLS